MSGDGKICFIIGNQRTGTNLLRSILAANDELSIAGEVITPSDHRNCWYNYIARRGIGAQGPQGWYDTSELVDAWIADLHASMAYTWKNGSTKTVESWVGGDIKYNQLRAISPVYWELSEIPFLLFYLEQRAGVVIHVRRRNTFKMILSAMIAEQSGVYHQSSPSAFASKFQINPGECIERMRGAKREEEMFLQLAARNQVVECFYEDLVESMAAVKAARPGAELSGPLLEIKTRLGIEGGFAVSPNFKKVVSQPYCEIISNFPELMSEVSRTEFAGMSQQILAEEAPEASAKSKQPRSAKPNRSAAQYSPGQ
jgi:LPS sulfotransferase NodH